MAGILGNLLKVLKQIGYTGMQQAHIIFQWKLKLIRVQLQKMKKKKAQKNMSKAYSGLGAEIYSLYKQGDQSEWRNMPAVQQELKMIEEAEAKVFQVDEVIDEINNSYLSKKEDIKERYSLKKADLTDEQSEKVE